MKDDRIPGVHTQVASVLVFTWARRSRSRSGGNCRSLAVRGGRVEAGREACNVQRFDGEKTQPLALQVCWLLVPDVGHRDNLVVRTRSLTAPDCARPP
eukprot:752246-Hanusia_phi.AAC.4